MSCPVCLADNHGKYYMPVDKFNNIIDKLIEAEGNFDLINLSGGEPTLHPELMDLIERARRPEITNISISTNGRIFLKDKGLLQKLIDKNVFISLQFDGFNDNAYEVLRGQKGLVEERLKILELLEKHSAQASLVMTVMNGVNNNEIEKVLSYFLKKDFIRSIMFQPVSFANPSFEYDISKVMTIPDVVKEIANGSDGLISESDIINLPCSHSSCFALGYLLKLENGGFVPVSKLVEIDKYLDIIKNRTMPGLEIDSYDKIKESVYNLWSTAGIQPGSEKILKTIKNIFCEIGKNEKNMGPNRLFKIAEKNIKSIFIHHFMDPYNFDLSRIVKCCNQYPVDAERLVPCCVYNNLMRRE
jgi:uncharacterized radical SAM superfamily Fe-S cluster-containing enzyme